MDCEIDAVATLWIWPQPDKNLSVVPAYAPLFSLNINKAALVETQLEHTPAKNYRDVK